MNGQAAKRAWKWGYYALGVAVGVYLVQLLVSELETGAGRDEIVRVAPVSLIVIAYFIVPLAAATQSWRLLFPRGGEPHMGWCAVLTWIGLSVNWLLPVAMVGGELVKLRLAVGRVAGTDELVASLVGDKTIQVATQLLYALLGLSLLAGFSDQVTGGVREVIGFLSFCAAVYVFYRLQRSGMFSGVAKRLKAFVRDTGPMTIRAERIDAAMDGLYRRAGRWWLAVCWRLAFRILMAVEVALVFWWLELPWGVASVLALESIAQASRVAALVVPAALGAQEAAIVAAGLLLGYPVDALLALAVVKRIRELVVGGAGLIGWQLCEARSRATPRSTN